MMKSEKKQYQAVAFNHKRLKPNVNRNIRREKEKIVL
jgi:hypothetical protein